MNGFTLDNDSFSLDNHRIYSSYNDLYIKYLECTETGRWYS